MGRESTIGKMDLSIMVILTMGLDLAMVFGSQAKLLNSLMNIKDNTKMTKRMDSANINGRMDPNMKDFSKMI